MQVTNRSDGIVTYSIPELNVHRTFARNETKDITVKELNQLYQINGGAEILRHFLLVHDREWVNKTWDPPLEYFWGEKEIIKCLQEDSIELFAETLDYAPIGVIDLIKEYSWRLPLTDLNKAEVLLKKTGFDAIAAIEVMKTDDTKQQAPTKGARLRKEE